MVSISLIDDWVSICELGFFSWQFHCWSRTSTAYRVINVSLLSSSNASRRPFSQHSSGTSMRALFSRQVVDVILVSRWPPASIGLKTREYAFPALASPISPVEMLRSSYGRLGSLPSSLLPVGQSQPNLLVFPTSLQP